MDDGEKERIKMLQRDIYEIHEAPESGAAVQQKYMLYEHYVLGDFDFNAVDERILDK
jgi:hypothetical protein